MIDSGVRGGICDSIFGLARGGICDSIFGLARGGIWDFIFGLARMKNNYMESYDQNKDSSYIVYLDKNNVYGSAMSRELPVNEFEWTKSFKKVIMTLAKVKTLFNFN